MVDAGAVVREGAVIGARAHIASGAVVLNGAQIPADQVEFQSLYFSIPTDHLCVPFMFPHLATLSFAIGCY